jgi:hypothetical protein
VRQQQNRSDPSSSMRAYVDGPAHARHLNSGLSLASFFLPLCFVVLAAVAPLLPLPPPPQETADRQQRPTRHSPKAKRRILKQFAHLFEINHYSLVLFRHFRRSHLFSRETSSLSRHVFHYLFSITVCPASASLAGGPTLVLLLLKDSSFGFGCCCC